MPKFLMAWLTVAVSATVFTFTDALAEEGFGELFMDVRATAEQRLGDAESLLDSAPAFFERHRYERPLLQKKQRLTALLADDEAGDGQVLDAANRLLYTAREFERGQAKARLRELNIDGDGSATDPYQIGSVEALQAMASQPTANFILIADIDASETADWNDGAGFEPIGDVDAPFRGDFDGNGHTITGLTLDRGDQDHVAMFAYTLGDIRNLELREPRINGRRYVAALASQSRGDFENIRVVDARITGESYVGGVAGRPRSDFRRVAVIGGSIEGEQQVGGIAGRATSRSSMYNSFSTAAVSGERFVGGLTGHTSSVDSTFEAVYAAGPVEGQRDVSGLIGPGSDDQASAAYWDIDATGQQSSEHGKGLSSSQMQGSVAEQYMQGFDFQEVWQTVNDGYPVLRE